MCPTPFWGKAKSLASGNGALDYVIGGFQTNAFSACIAALRVSGDIANAGNSNNAGYYERLNVVGDPHLSNPSPAQWFNAFAVPATFTYGNLGRDTLRSDWAKNVDLSLFRDFRFANAHASSSERERSTFTNTPVWGTPVSNYSNTNFARVLSGTRRAATATRFETPVLTRAAGTTFHRGSPVRLAQADLLVRVLNLCRAGFN